MPLTNIDSAKELAASYQPLLLATFTFADGSVLRLSTHPLNASEGGFQYNGNDYFARILEQDIAAVQALSEGGIDITPTVTLHLADADHFLWTNFERAEGKGFKGARLELRFVFWEANTSTYSSDSIVKFVGICGQPESSEDALVVSAQSLLNLQKQLLPIVPIQRRCPWVFPTTHSERQQAADNEDSIFFRCGYSPDIGGPNARGNNDPLTGEPFTECGYTFSDCIARLGDSSRVPPYNATTNKPPIMADKLNRNTGRFGGITYDPPQGGRGREYVSGQWFDFRNNPNEAKYGDYIPLVYGTGWVDALVVNVIGDGNYTRGEAIVCLGTVEGILRVIVNDVELSAATDINGTPYAFANQDLRYHVINRGDRDGAPNLGAGWEGKGDPYGSICVINWVVPRRVADSASVPRIKVLVQGPQLRVYSDPNTFLRQYTNNPVWILADLLAQTNFKFSDLEISDFISAANFCSQLIPYTDQNGNLGMHERYGCNLVIRQRRPAAEIIRGVRQACNAVLQPNRDNGKLGLLIKSTLAQQQPNPVEGSNYNTPVFSRLPDGTPANGYVAYLFNASTILQDEQGQLKFRRLPRAVSDSPNRVNFTFGDAEFGYAASSMSLVDSQDIARAQQEVPIGLQVDGIPNFDQANRIAQIYLAEQNRGNPSGDTRGTDWYEFETSFRAVRVRIGQICLLDLPKKGIENQLVRIARISPSTNFETVRITVHHHSDDWYLDSFGQTPDPQFGGRRRDRLARPSLPWAPYQVQPAAGDPMFDREDWTFSLMPVYETLADGTARPRLEVKGRIPVNQFAEIAPPLVGPQGTTASMGGTIAGGGWVYYVAICAKDAEGRLSAPSTICRIAVTLAGSTHTITVPVLSWDSSTVGYSVFAGTNPTQLTWQTDGSGTPSSITLSEFKTRTYGVPDVEFDRLRLRVKRIAHSGVFGAAITGVSANQIEIAGAGWTVNQWAGYDLSLLAKGVDGPIPLLNFRVTSNTDSILTVTPDPAALGLQPGDVIVMRSKPTVSNGGRTFTDPNWQNTLANNGNGMIPSEEIGRIVRIIAGAGRGQTNRIASATATSVTVAEDWETMPDSTSRYIIEEAAWLQDQADSTPVNNSDPAATDRLLLPVENLKDLSLLLQVLTLDGGENASIESMSPVREIFILGSVFSPTVAVITVTTDTVLSAVSQIVLADTTSQPVTITLPDAEQMIGRRITIKRISAGSNDVTIQTTNSQTIDGSLTITLTTQWDSITVEGRSE